MKKPTSKSIARIAAIQVIYQFIIMDGPIDINSLLLKTYEFYKDVDFNEEHGISERIKLSLKPSCVHLTKLVRRTHSNLLKIDSDISQFLNKSWTITNLPSLLRAILRVAICEINCFSNTPKNVVINEYTNIANDMMLDLNEVGFVNCILHNYAHSQK